MNEVSTDGHSDLAMDCQKLVNSQKTLLLSTASQESVPDISYAPYVRDQQGNFYIYVSELAAHTRNLLSNPLASVLFIRPETDSANLFARERVIFRCSVDRVMRDDEIYSSTLKALRDKFGDVVSVLSSLPDFHLFSLEPTHGLYIVGFGQAYTINLSDNSLAPVIPRSKP